MEDYKKKYEDAFERAKVINPGTADYEVVVKIFPELKESEDERIRKELIQSIKGNMCVIHKDKCIAWLEKQSKQEQLYIRFGEIPTDEKSKIHQGEIEVGTENGVYVYPAFKTDEGDIVLGLNLPITKTTLYSQQHLIEYDDRPCYLVKGDYVGKDTDGQPLINNISIIEKIDGYRVKEKKQNEQKLTNEEILNILRSMVHGTYEIQSQETVDELLSWLESIKHQSHWKPSDEQKLADKVEPKFKIGDWINKDGAIWRIEGVSGKEYILGGRPDAIIQEPIHIIDSEFRLWTIQDAKDGDVLATKDGDICIFNGSITEDSHPFAHCGLTQYGFEVYDETLPFTFHSIYPATKEQCDFLFLKMKEAGYEWDAEKKELKKKPAWSEEDERISKAIYQSIDYPCLESFGVSEDEVYDWFKSLKTYYHWKPSDEHMKMLKQWLDEHRYDGNSRYIYAMINSLYEQLKSLKENN